IFGVNLNLLPFVGWGSWQHMVMPMFVLGLGAGAFLTRITRASMLEAIRQDYVRTARSKGLRERTVIVGHALKNALIPVATIIGPATAGLITGSFIIETLFNVPGMGRLYIISILDDEGAGDEAGRRWTDDGRDRYEGVLQSMADDHCTFAQPLASRGADVVLTDGLEHAGPRDPGEERPGPKSKHEHRHDHVLPASPTDEREQIQVHPEDVNEEDRDHERGDRRADGRHEHARVV